MSNLHTVLAQVVPAINCELEHINRGGCGIFAYELSEALARKGIPSDIVLVKYSWYDKDDVQHLLDSHGTADINEVYLQMFGDAWHRYCDPCMAHICVRVDGKVYDNEGEQLFTPISEPIRPDVMALAIKKSNWNPTFLQSNCMTQLKAVGIIAKFLSSTLSEVVA